MAIVIKAFLRMDDHFYWHTPFSLHSPQLIESGTCENYDLSSFSPFLFLYRQHKYALHCAQCQHIVHIILQYT